jgi:protein-S-isoprenylcysteine O-methyltransferase Ste14
MLPTGSGINSRRLHMSLIPDFSIGIWNAWLFMIIFPLQWLAVIIIPGRVSTRVSHTAETHLSLWDKIAGKMTNILWILATLYSIFIPLDTGKPWFYIGLAFFAAGLLILISSTITVFKATEDKPFTAGVYRYSRHPMYLSMVLIYIAVSVASAS